VENGVCFSHVVHGDRILEMMYNGLFPANRQIITGGQIYISQKCVGSEAIFKGSDILNNGGETAQG